MANFVTQLKSFIEDLARYDPTNSNIKKFLTVYPELDGNKLLAKFYAVMKPHENYIVQKDDSLFNSSLVLFSNIDLAEIWQKLGKGQRAKSWIQLTILLIKAEISTKQVTSKAPEPASTQTSLTLQKAPFEFNPYIGIGSDNPNFGVDNLSVNLDTLPDQSSTGVGVGAVAKLMGIDKMFNMEDLQNQLQNMTDNDIEQATQSIKNMLGPNVDEKTGAIMGDMLKSITEELKKSDMSGSNPFDSLTKIADVVSQKIHPKFADADVDMSKLWQSTRNISTQLKDKNGNSVFGNNKSGTNPFDMLNGVMSGQMSEKDCLNSCNTMLKNLGVDPTKYVGQLGQSKPPTKITKKPRRF